MVAPTVGDVAGFFPKVNLDSYANEILLLHRTHQSSATKIMQQGFDQRLAQRRLYGRGIYFTAESCKARQAGKRHHDTSCIILTRVVLGHPFVAEGAMSLRSVSSIMDPDNNPDLWRCALCRHGHDCMRHRKGKCGHAHQPTCCRFMRPGAPRGDIGV